MKAGIILSFVVFNFSVGQANSKIILNISCDKMESNLQAVRQWTNSRSQSCQLGEVTEKPNANPPVCHSDISKCLPAEVLSLNGKAAVVNGPNCWNLAMVMAGVVPALRHSTPEEMAFFMNSPLCRTLESGEKKQPGDIGALRAGSQEVHGFMWVSDDLVFSKNGMSKHSPYKIQGTEDMIGLYTSYQKKVCQQVPGVPCDLELATLRCQSMEKYLSAPGRKIPKEIQAAFIRLEKADKCLSNFHFKPSSHSLSAKKNIIDGISVVAAVFESPEFKDKMNSLPKDQRNFIQGSLLTRLEAMHYQMNSLSQEGTFCLTCRKVAKELRRAGEAFF